MEQNLELNLEMIHLSYKITNREVIKYLEHLVGNLEQENKEEMMTKLTEWKQEFERLMEVCHALEEEGQNEILMKEIQYGLLDGLFLFSDLLTFYDNDLKDRFKLRAMNYIKKDQVNRLL